MMTTEDKEELTQLFNTMLDKRDRIDAATHKIHHETYAKDLEERSLRAERFEMVRRQVTGWGIIVFLAAIGTAVAQYFGDHIWK